MSGGNCWGNVVLYRSSAIFSDEEVATVASLSRPLAEGIRLSLLRSAAHRANGDGPGMVVVRGTEITATSATGERWLKRLDEGRVPTAMLSICARARAEGAVIARVACKGGGWMTLHASRIEGLEDGDVAIILDEARPIHLAPVLVAALGLTERERDVVEHVLQGQPTKQIARSLSISAYTVQDHLKSIFEKTGVRTRGELALRLLNDHYDPRRRRGALPGPRGWFADD